ncbi:sigma-70 family RNA polymerase sigma factor [Parasediminibacterium sp. JCM 36343]|uniref:sigma-70 family RNA polymerase sigma factor n=1 Tax=Parasediminibacterium sp. JCM 36343 TaxID=3374279 RepID=UPI003978656A
MRSYAHATDNNLVRAFQEGDTRALEALIQRHKDRVFTFILVLVKDQLLAEDIFQEVFCKIIVRLRNKQYADEGKFLPWVTSIAHNYCVDYFRKIQLEIPVPHNAKEFFENIGDKGDVADMQLIREQSHDKVRMMLNFLPAEQKEVIVLRHFGELSFKEIASLTNTTLNTCLGRMRYALINMRRLIAEHEIVL